MIKTLDFVPLLQMFIKYVMLDKTFCRVMAQVSCEVTEPKQTRPTEGILFVNVELSPMAAPHFEAGR